MNDAQMAGTGAVGFCDPETQTIGLVGSQPNDSMQDTFLHGLEQQPCGVQVVEWVGLVYLLIRGKPDGSIIGIPEGEG